jgi:hypothetical protein
MGWALPSFLAKAVWVFLEKPPPCTPYILGTWFSLFDEQFFENLQYAWHENRNKNE